MKYLLKVIFKKGKAEELMFDFAVGLNPVLVLIWLQQEYFQQMFFFNFFFIFFFSDKFRVMTIITCRDVLLLSDILLGVSNDVRSVALLLKKCMVISFCCVMIKKLAEVG